MVNFYIVLSVDDDLDTLKGQAKKAIRENDGDCLVK
jgi:hypothetical protein